MGGLGLEGSDHRLVVDVSANKKGNGERERMREWIDRGGKDLPPLTHNVRAILRT